MASTPPPLSRSPLSRRTFLTGMAVAAGGTALTACGGGGGSGPAQELSASRLFDSRALKADGTPQRMVWALSDLDGYITSTAPDSITVSAVQNGTVLLDSVRIDAHRDGVLVPYYPIHLAFGDSSAVELTFEADGVEFTGFTDARGTDTDGLVGRGELMPSVATPLFSDPRGADPVCTRSPEPCPFHDVSLDEALSGNNKIIVNVSTPAFCGNQIACGPGLEVLIDVSPEIPDDVVIIHTEVYTAPTGRELGPVAPIMDAVGLWFEPALYVIERDGSIIERLDFMWDRADLRQAVALLS